MDQQAKKTGRPSTYSDEMAEQICSLIAEGKTVTQICRMKGMPPMRTIFRWLESHESFRQKYARARECQADVFASQIIEISDKCRKGKRIETTERGRHCSVCGDAVIWYKSAWAHKDAKTPLCEGGKAEKTLESKVVVGDTVDRSRLQVDARKWYAAKAAPKKYGERVQAELSGPDGGPIQLDLTKLSDAQLQALLEISATLAEAQGAQAEG